MVYADHLNNGGPGICMSRGYELLQFVSWVKDGDDGERNLNVNNCGTAGFQIGITPAALKMLRQQEHHQKCA